MRMESFSGKSTLSRFAICSGLHASDHGRSLRWGLFRPVNFGGCGPAMMLPSGRLICPDNRSWTYVRSRGLVSSFAVFGRRAVMSAFHCATDARYCSFPLRVAALRRSSREIVAGSRPIARAISRTPLPCALSSAISSLSAKPR